jgi:hypothetical protein
VCEWRKNVQRTEGEERLFCGEALQKELTYTRMYIVSMFHMWKVRQQNTTVTSTDSGARLMDFKAQPPVS